MNTVALLGRLTRDPEMKGTVTHFCVAVDGGWDKDKQNKVVDFIDCKAFSKTAEIVNQYLAKGSQVVITGRLKKETWEGQNGKQSKMLVYADKVDFVGPKAEKAAEPDPQEGYSALDEECPF